MFAARARASLSIALAAAILLIPAVLFGRPFIFYDTPVYWGWGHDVLAALARPWSHAGQPWVAGRPLMGWELGAHGATQGDLRFTLTAIEARSIFYAVPLALLSDAGGLWLVVTLQALVAAWTLHVAVGALAPAARTAGYLLVVAALTALTGVGFEAGYAMPDLFGGLALLAAGLLVATPERLVRWARFGLAAVAAYAALAHAENGLNLAAALAAGAALFAREGWKAQAARLAPLALALLVSAALGAAGHAALGQAFGRPSHPAPFLASRVLADGGGQRWLASVCPRAGLAACDLAGVHAGYPEYYLALYPLQPPPDLGDAAHAYDRLQFIHASDAVAAKRERFVGEEPAIVLGAAITDGPRLAAAALARSAAELVAGAVAPDFDSLSGLAREHTQRLAETRAFLPAAQACAAGQGHVCGPLDIGALALVQRLALYASLVAMAALALRRAAPPDEALRRFTALMLILILTNAVLCGALSGLYDRYQIRVAWLAPLCMALWAAGVFARRAGARATLPSPVPTTLPPIAAERRP